MATAKNVVWIVVLLAIIASAIVFGIKASRKGPIEPTDWVLAQPAEKIDSETLEVMKKSLGEWEKLGSREGRYKNPDTGAYTMVPTMTCPACGEKIPSPFFVISAPAGSGMSEGGTPAGEDREYLAGYKCPRCGASAMQAPRR